MRARNHKERAGRRLRFAPACLIAIGGLVLSACNASPRSTPTDGESARQPEAPAMARQDSAAPTPSASTDAAQATAANPAGSGSTAAAVPAPEPVLLPSDELDAGWISLFDGGTLYGWTPDSQADWRVEDGTIVVGSGEKGLLLTNTQFADYVLRIEFLAQPGTNSGVFLQTLPQPKDPGSDFYELNIADSNNGFPTGSLVQRQKADIDAPSGQWHLYEATVEGDQVSVKLDDRPTVQYTDPKPLRRGHIGLQFNTGQVAFRNIRLKPLGTGALFNGRDLSGWKTYPEMASKFTATDAGELRVVDGRGQLETENEYADFVLQLECQTHAPNLNSGVFFRCSPGEVMNGYECQIHNGTLDGDRTRPQDCGTGGFFRRQDARRIVADDLKWFHLTLVADGARMAAWVDGYQVSDWTDTRPPDSNPRRGLRLEPGTIMLQGHDPTTDISFRNLRIAAWPPRGG